MASNEPIKLRDTADSLEVQVEALLKRHPEVTGYYVAFFVGGDLMTELDTISVRDAAWLAAKLSFRVGSN